jgi:succinate dehydrogenase / fumarate reductase membrane anchor subunit
MSFQAQGMRAWLLQRLTAVYVAIYILSLMTWIIVKLPVSYESWLTLLSQPFMLIATVLFYISIFIHAWVGIRDILVDYIKPSGVRFMLLTSLAFFLIVMTMWLLIIFVGLVKV